MTHDTANVPASSISNDPNQDNVGVYDNNLVETDLASQRYCDVRNGLSLENCYRFTLHIPDTVRNNVVGAGQDAVVQYHPDSDI